MGIGDKTDIAREGAYVVDIACCIEAASVLEKQRHNNISCCRDVGDQVRNMAARLKKTFMYVTGIKSDVAYPFLLVAYASGNDGEERVIVSIVLAPTATAHEFSSL